MMPPWVLLDEQQAQEYVTEPGWHWQPDHPPPANTWRLRQANDRRRLNVPDLTFANTLRKCSEMWHKTLTEGQRSDWINNGPFPRGPRPGRLAGPNNGWNAFVMMAFAPFYFGQGNDPAFHKDDETDPTGLTFTVADSDTQLLHFIISLAAPPPVGATGYVFIHQLDPLWIGRPDANRRTELAGGYAVIPNGPHEQPFSVEAPFSFAAVDQVFVLARFHQYLHGVINYERNQDAS